MRASRSFCSPRSCGVRTPTFPFAVGKAVYARSLIAASFAVVGAARAVAAALAPAAHRVLRGAGTAGLAVDEACQRGWV